MERDNKELDPKNFYKFKISYNKGIFRFLDLFPGKMLTITLCYGIALKLYNISVNPSFGGFLIHKMDS